MEEEKKQQKTPSDVFYTKLFHEIFPPVADPVSQYVDVLDSCLFNKLDTSALTRLFGYRQYEPFAAPCQTKTIVDYIPCCTETLQTQDGKAQFTSDTRNFAQRGLDALEEIITSEILANCNKHLQNVVHSIDAFREVYEIHGSSFMVLVGTKIPKEAKDLLAFRYPPAQQVMMDSWGFDKDVIFVFREQNFFSSNRIGKVCFDRPTCSWKRRTDNSQLDIELQFGCKLDWDVTLHRVTPVW
jgi:hypothetical protein